MEHQNIIFTNAVSDALTRVLQAKKFNKLFVITDSNTRRKVLPRLADNQYVAEAVVVEFPAGDVNKNIDSLTSVWQQIGEAGGTRHSLAVNLGGGVVTDLGGFAAATFKRGIPFVNIPTTLLSAVDAAIGGKTGINFNGLKNEVGAFCEASDVIISTAFLDTLPEIEVKSGYAEMLKHGLLKSRECFMSLVNFDVANGSKDRLLELLKESVEVKAEIVRQDPHEHGIRRALNLGHTAGHAFESMAMARQKPIPHGYAVAYGMVCELYLSCVKAGFPTDIMHTTVRYINDCYGKMAVTCDDYPTLFDLMTHDKKNTAGIINFTLLSSVGGIEINQTATRDEIYEALDFYREN